MKKFRFPLWVYFVIPFFLTIGFSFLSPNFGFLIGAIGGFLILTICELIINKRNKK